MTVWAATPHSEIVHARTETAYTRLRRLAFNIQADYSQMDVETYGKTIHELLKLRSDTTPEISKGDRLYLSEPCPLRTVEINGEQMVDYGPGQYRVEAVRPAFFSGGRLKNPTTIEAVRISK